MSVELGISPERLIVHLTRGADFDAILTYTGPNGQDTDWPAGTTLTLEFSGGAVSWPATITGPDAVFSVDKVQADTVSANADARVRYVNGTTDHIYYAGKVVRHD